MGLLSFVPQWYVDLWTLLDPWLTLVTLSLVVLGPLGYRILIGYQGNYVVPIVDPKRKLILLVRENIGGIPHEGIGFTPLQGLKNGDCPEANVESILKRKLGIDAFYKICNWRALGSRWLYGQKRLNRLTSYTSWIVKLLKGFLGKDYTGIFVEMDLSPENVLEINQRLEGNSSEIIDVKVFSLSDLEAQFALACGALDLKHTQELAASGESSKAVIYCNVLDFFSEYFKNAQEQVFERAKNHGIKTARRLQEMLKRQGIKAQCPTQQGDTLEELQEVWIFVEKTSETLPDIPTAFDGLKVEVVPHKKIK